MMGANPDNRTVNAVAIASSTSPASQALQEALSFLAPPEQQYDLLADRLGQLLTAHPDMPPLERALATYFYLFGQGYATWQTCYDYHLIHEYFYGAYLGALREGGAHLPAPIATALDHFSQAFIAHTWCENAIISNDASRLQVEAGQALVHAVAARELFLSAGAEHLLGAAVIQYLETNIAHFRAQTLCAQMHLSDPAAPPDPTVEAAIRSAIDFVETRSREHFSELRAHYTFAKRWTFARKQATSRLRVRQASMQLRAIAYAGDDLIGALFQKVTPDDDSAGSLRDVAAEIMGLPIEDFRNSILQDLFETSLGREFLRQVIIDLPAGDGALSFVAADGDREIRYFVDSLQVHIERFGSVAVEFGLSVEDASVSHLRVLESLIAPHTGRYDIVWRDAPIDSDRGSPDFVDTYFRAQAWAQRIRAEMDGQESAALALFEGELHVWRDLLTQLAYEHSRLLEDVKGSPSAGAGTTKADGARGVREQLRSRLSRLRTLAEACMEQEDIRALPSYSTFAREQQYLFAAGLHFGYLRDVAEEILDRVSRFLASLLPSSQRSSVTFLHPTEITEHTSLHRVVTFDANTGWQIVTTCNQLAVISRGDGDTAEPDSIPELAKVQAALDYRGLIVQSREARASLDDWLFVPEPQHRNLATIRSHEGDLMVVGENRVFLYLPDDPQYLVAQYEMSAGIIGDIRTIVLGFNTTAKNQIDRLEGFLHHLQEGEGALGQSRVVLLQQRDDIEVFRTNSDKILDLVGSYTISKYQDHSELLEAMVHESGVGRFQMSLEHKMVTLNRFHTYLSDLIQRKIEARSQANQRVIAVLLFVLSFLSALSAIDPVASYLGRILGTPVSVVESVTYLAVLVAILLSGGLIFLRMRTLR